MLRLVLLLILTALIPVQVWAAEAKAEIPVFSTRQARVYLDVDADVLATNGLERAAADFERCFRVMTGVVLPSRLQEVAWFDPSTSEGCRLQARVVGMADLSRLSAENGTVSLVMTPSGRLEGHPLGGPGEKAAWTCTWQRAEKKLQFALIVANQPYRGPGYGPFTFATLSGPVPDWQAGQTLDLALELRHADGKDLRGGYRINGQEWNHTQWFDPTKAGSDGREPGVSDRNGPQDWSTDWPTKWSGRTACYVTGYASKERQGLIRVDDVKVTADDDVLFSDTFDGPDGSAVSSSPNWRRGPLQGQATFDRGAALLAPERGTWSTVGLLAARQPVPPPPDAIPLTLHLDAYPEGRERFEAEIVQGFRIEATAAEIAVHANTPLGLRNSLYYLLQRWGCRWVMVGELGECIPHVERLAVPEGTLRFAPRSDFSVEPSGSGSTYAQFWSRNLAGWQNWLSAQHYWLYAIPAEKHFADHPQWFSLIAGERRPRQLCTSNPEVIAEMIRVAKATLAGNANRISFPMDPMDNIDFCECKACRALDAPGQFTSGAPSMTDRVLHFANAVAAGIKDEFPDRYVAFYAYWSHSNLPVVEKPADNVVIVITRSGNCMLHLTPQSYCAKSDFHGFVRAWQNLTPNVYCYEYDPISWTGGLPCPTYLDMGRSLRTLLLNRGVKGSYSDGGVRPSAWAGTFLNRYIPLRIKVNPDQQPEAVLRDTCQVFFGPAADPLEQYYLELANVTESTHPGISSLHVGSTYYHLLFNPDMIEQARSRLNEGARLARGKPPYEQRVAMVDLAQQYLESYLQGIWAAQEKDYDRSVAGFDRMDRNLQALAEKGWLDGKDAPARAKSMRLKALAEHFPQRLGFVTDWKLLGPFDNSSSDADRRRDPFEPVDGVATPEQLGNGKEATWWDYRIPSGFLNLEQATDGKKGAWTLSYAYAATTFEARQTGPAQLKLDSFFPYRVFVNGAEVFYRPGLNADCPDRKSVDVQLRQGSNLIVVKLCQTQITTDSHPWGLYLRVVTDDTKTP